MNKLQIIGLRLTQLSILGIMIASFCYRNSGKSLYDNNQLLAIVLAIMALFGMSAFVYMSVKMIANDFQNARRLIGEIKALKMDCNYTTVNPDKSETSA